MTSYFSCNAFLPRPASAGAGSLGGFQIDSCGFRSCFLGLRMHRIEAPTISTTLQCTGRPASPLTARASPRAPSPSPGSHSLHIFPSLAPRESPFSPSSPAFPPSSPVSALGPACDSSPLASPPASHRLLSREQSTSSPSSAMRASASSNGLAGVEAEVSDEQQGRAASVRRVTKETNITLSIHLDGTGLCSSSTGIPFLDHMMDQLSSHGLFDLTLKAEGDYHIDDHHTNEDVGLALGTALAEALGDRKGIRRFGDFSAPLDEALIHVVLDLSGRPHLSYDLEIPTERVGTYDTQLVEHFFQSLVNTSGMTLHIRQLAGRNSHHIIEATFKAFARALRMATEADPRRAGIVPSSKGVLSQQ